MKNCSFRTDNVLIKIEIAKVADFGLSWFLDQSQTTEKKPWRWTAPEVHENIQNTTVKSDVHSFGALVFEALQFGQVPYPSYGPNERHIWVSNAINITHYVWV